MTDEARRLLRYVFPGVAAAGLFLLLWVFVFPGHLRLPTSLAGEGGGGAAIAGALGAVVAGGALGYVASHAYFFLHWHSSWMRWFGPNNHHSVATFIRDAVGPWEEPDAPHLGELRRDWVTLTAWWFLSAGVDPRVKSSLDRTTSLMDHAHSSGVFACAIAMAGLSWAVVIGFLFDRVQSSPPYGEGFIGLVITGGIALLLLRNSYATRLMFDHLVDVTARQAIRVRTEELSAFREPNDAGGGDAGDAEPERASAGSEAGRRAVGAEPRDSEGAEP